MDLAGRILLILFGIGMIALGLRSYRLNSRAAHWPGTEGIILESTRTQWDQEPSSRIRYLYRVGDRDYESRIVTYAAYSSGRHEEWLQRYQVGDSVRVRFDPDQPSRAALEIAPSNGWMSFAGIGAGMIALGLLLG